MTNIPLASPQSETDEKINGYTHLAGAVLCLPGAWFIIKAAVESGNFWYVVSSIVYMLSMTVLYSASSFYHLAKGDYIKRIGRIFDHASIYILIAGTYTPVAFKIWEPWGVVILSLIWGLALTGFLLKLFFWNRMKVIHLLIYLGMGWVIIFFWPVVTQKVSPEFIRYAFAGGISYSLGVVFYAVKKIPFGHGIWHLFVLAGSVIFYFGILFQIFA